jgi:hypothetical protein
MHTFRTRHVFKDPIGDSGRWRRKFGLIESLWKKLKPIKFPMVNKGKYIFLESDPSRSQCPGLSMRSEWSLEIERLLMRFLEFCISIQRWSSSTQKKSF